MKKKSVLVDLSSLISIYEGLGQVAMSYGKYFQKTYKRSEAGYRLTLLLPKKMFGMFGNEVQYISSTNWFLKHSIYLFPKFDVWHSIHQLSRFRPAYASTKHILTIHDLNYLYEAESEKIIRKNNRRHYRKIRRAGEIVCISEFAKSEVEKNFQLGGKTCRVIYNKINLLDTAAARKPAAEIKTPFFFSIGVVLKKKNFHVLFDMMKLMPDKHLYIAGKDVHRYEETNQYVDMLRERIQNENITNVTLLGPISHEEKIWMYLHCEALLIPSLFEGFGMPVIEAMQFGKPVFSSQETSLKEIGNRFAFFWDNFEPGNMKSLIDRNLTGFYDNKEFIEEEIEYAKSYGSNRHFEEYEKLYLNRSE